MRLSGDHVAPLAALASRTERYLAQVATIAIAILCRSWSMGRSAGASRVAFGRPLRGQAAARHAERAWRSAWCCVRVVATATALQDRGQRPRRHAMSPLDVFGASVIGHHAPRFVAQVFKPETCSASRGMPPSVEASCPRARDLAKKQQVAGGPSASGLRARQLVATACSIELCRALPPGDAAEVARRLGRLADGTTVACGPLAPGLIAPQGAARACACGV